MEENTTEEEVKPKKAYKKYTCKHCYSEILLTNKVHHEKTKRCQKFRKMNRNIHPNISKFIDKIIVLSI